MKVGVGSFDRPGRLLRTTPLALLRVVGARRRRAPGDFGTETAVPGVLVEEQGYLSFALQCRHCEDAPCLEACITGAMYRDPESGAVLADEERCVGCWMCIMLCPFGVISRNVEGKRVISKCNHCQGEEIPVCVKNCPNEAIVFEEEK